MRVGLNRDFKTQGGTIEQGLYKEGGKIEQGLGKVSYSF